MGRKGRIRQRQRHAHVGESTREDNRRDYVLTPKENKLFEQYYQGQAIVLPEDWDEFMETLRQPLPSTFRITGFRSHATELLRIIKSDYLHEIVNIEIDGRRIQPTKCLPWYPDELAWQLDLDRKLIRQNDSLKRLHQFLVQETESGYISRQEAVSMIPPLLLNVQPNSRVLDMCAAPGSKTAQLIEMLHANDTSSPPDGLVVANDSDNKRCYLMVHQVRRLVSSNFIVMNMDASNLPSFTMTQESGEKKSVKFDRILCDVPCSGDGTLRKNVDAWQRWNPAIGHGLHNLQVRILRRGLELLEVGGRIVYSTCSFNPVEDEAVVSTVLEQMMGSVELVDVSDRLPGLLRENGISSWKIMSKQGEWFEKYEDVPERLRSQITRSVFPPSPEQAERFGLHKCIRILPHKQNTGGFFVAVLEKRCTMRETQGATATIAIPPTVDKSCDTGKDEDHKSAVDVSNAGESVLGLEAASSVLTVDAGGTAAAAANGNDDAGETSEGLKRKREDGERQPYVKKPKYFGFREDPFIFLKQEDTMWAPIQRFFGISADFPFGQLMVRCEMGKKRNIYFVSSVIKKVVQENEDKFKFINLGVKVLSRSESKMVDCEFRLVQDGLHLLYPYITKRVVKVGGAEDIVTLLSCENPYINRMSKPAQEQLNSLGQGGCVFVYEPTEGQAGPQCRLVLCGWKGKISCRSFLPKFERGHYLRLCGEELKSHAERKLAEKAATAGGTVVTATSEQVLVDAVLNDELPLDEDDDDSEDGIDAKAVDDDECDGINTQSEGICKVPEACEQELGKE
jgi:tRNA (cytosine34-C5)-methyltransferase